MIKALLKIIENIPVSFPINQNFKLQQELSLQISELVLTLLMEQVIESIFKTSANVNEKISQNPQFLMQLYNEIELFYSNLLKEPSFTQEQLDQKNIEQFIQGYFNDNINKISEALSDKINKLNLDKIIYQIWLDTLEVYFKDIQSKLLTELQKKTKAEFIDFLNLAQHKNKELFDQAEKATIINTESLANLAELYNTGHYPSRMSLLSSFVITFPSQIPAFLAIGSQLDLSQSILQKLRLIQSDTNLNLIAEDNNLYDILRRIKESTEQDKALTEFITQLKVQLKETTNLINAADVCFPILLNNLNNFEPERRIAFKNTLLYCALNQPQLNLNRSAMTNLTRYLEKNPVDPHDLFAKLPIANQYFLNLQLPTKIDDDTKKLYCKELFNAAKVGNTPFIYLVLSRPTVLQHTKISSAKIEVLESFYKGFIAQIAYTIYKAADSYFRKNSNKEIEEITNDLSIIEAQIGAQLIFYTKLELQLLLQDPSLVSTIDAELELRLENYLRHNNIALKIFPIRSSGLFSFFLFGETTRLALPRLEDILNFLSTKISASKMHWDAIEYQKKSSLMNLICELRSVHNDMVSSRANTLKSYLSLVYETYNPFKYQVETKFTRKHTFHVNNDLLPQSGSTGTVTAPWFLLQSFFSTYLNPNDILDEDGNTLLDIAMEYNQPEVAGLCLMLGVNIHKQNLPGCAEIKATDKRELYIQAALMASRGSTELLIEVKQFLFQYQQDLIARENSLIQQLWKDILCTLSESYKENEQKCEQDRNRRFKELKKRLDDAEHLFHGQKLFQFLQNMLNQISKMPRGISRSSQFGSGLQAIANKNYTGGNSQVGTEMSLWLFELEKLTKNDLLTNEPNENDMQYAESGSASASSSYGVGLSSSVTRILYRNMLHPRGGNEEVEGEAFSLKSTNNEHAGSFRKQSM